jgi:prepilin-type N-terminal cleavage/methylation domain-containing protein
MNKGFSLIEVVIAAAIILVVSVSVVTMYARYVRSASSTDESLKASYLAEEGIEVMKHFRDSSWGGKILNLSTSTSYMIEFSTSTSSWSTSTTPQLIDGMFDRRITLSNAYRNVTSDISTSTVGTTYDGNLRLITVIVSWKNGLSTSTKTLSSYIANLYLN